MNYQTLLAKKQKELKKSNWVSLGNFKNLGDFWLKDEEVLEMLKNDFFLDVSKLEKIESFHRELISLRLKKDLRLFIDENNIRREEEINFSSYELDKRLEEEIKEEFLHIYEYEEIEEIKEFYKNFESIDTMTKFFDDEEIKDNYDFLYICENNLKGFSNYDIAPSYNKFQLEDYEEILEEIQEKFQDIISSLLDDIENHKENLFDSIQESVDNLIPIYNWELLKYASENSEFWYVDDMGLLPENPDLFDFIKTSIYEYLLSSYSEIQEKVFEEYKKEIEEYFNM
jgi:hypothetical protein